MIDRASPVTVFGMILSHPLESTMLVRRLLK